MRIAFRVAPDELAQIDRLAEQRGLNRTDYVIACALGVREDAGQDTGLEARVDELRDRIDRLEKLAFGLD